MMKLIIHDGRIRATGNVAFSADTDEFEEVAPDVDVAGLAAGAMTVIYEPDAPDGRPKHRRYTADGRQLAGTLPWAEGDAILAAAADSLAALQQLRAARRAMQQAVWDAGGGLIDGHPAPAKPEE
jgi:hypothetical protein